MKTLNIYINSLKQYLVGIKLQIFIFLIIPLLLSYVYGLIYKNISDPNRTIPKFTVAYVDLDKSSLSKPLIEIFNNEKLKSILALQEVSPTADIKSKLIDGTYSAAIVIPKAFSQDITSGKTASIDVLKAPSSGVNGDIIESIVTAYSKNLDVNRGVYAALMKNTKDANLSQQVFNEVLPQINVALNKSYINYYTLNKTKKLSTTQDYSSSMLIMFSLFIAIAQAGSMIIEREYGLLSRIESTSTSKLNYYFGKLLAAFTISLGQITSFIIITTFVSGVDWGNTFSTILIILTHSLAIVGVAAILSSLFKVQKTMSIVASLIIMVMSMLSGAMIPSEYMIGFIKTASHFTINYWLKTSYSNIMLGDQLRTVIPNLGILVFISAILITFGSIKFKYTK